MVFDIADCETLIIRTGLKELSPGGGHGWRDVAGVPTIRLVYPDSSTVTAQRRDGRIFIDAPGREPDPAGYSCNEWATTVTLMPEIKPAAPPADT